MGVNLGPGIFPALNTPNKTVVQHIKQWSKQQGYIRWTMINEESIKLQNNLGLHQCGAQGGNEVQQCLLQWLADVAFKVEMTIRRGGRALEPPFL